MKQAVWKNGGYLAGAAGVLLVLFGGVQALRAHRALGETARKIDETRRQIAALQAEAAEMERYAAARRMWEQAAATPAPDLVRLFRTACPGTDPGTVRESYSELGDGWRICRKTFDLSDAPLDGVMAFVRAAEASRPPWRLVECGIHAGSRPGVGNVRLVFQTLIPPSRR